MRHVIWLLLVACASTRAPLPANHPANPSAPAGRLAGPPPSLRAGVVDYSSDVPPLAAPAPAPEHHHHGS